MKIISLKKMSIPKIAVLATGAVAALLVATIGPAPAQASPSYASACTDCHTAGGSVAAKPSSATLVPGAAYTVALTFTGGSSPVGYWISGNGASVTASNAGPVSMTAPAAIGSYTYIVWMRSGVVATAKYSITVAAAPTTTTTTTPPTSTTTTTSEPPVTSTTSEPPATSTTSEPPVIATPIPPVSTASIRSLSPTHGAVGTKVKIRGTDFGTSGVVKFGNVTAKASSWTNTTMVVKVPNIAFSMGSKTVAVPVWYRHDQTFSVTVTPTSAAASNAVRFRLDSRHGHGHGHGNGHSDD